MLMQNVSESLEISGAFRRPDNDPHAYRRPRHTKMFRTEWRKTFKYLRLSLFV